MTGSAPRRRAASCRAGVGFRYEHPAGARRSGRLQAEQPDRAASEDRHGVPQFQARYPHRVHRHRTGLAEGRGLVADADRYGHGLPPLHDHVLGIGAERFAGEAHGAEVIARVGPDVVAHSRRGSPSSTHDPVAHGPTPHAWADFGDGLTVLVPQDRSGGDRVVEVPVHVGAADGAVFHPHKHLVQTGRGRGHILDAEPSAALVNGSLQESTAGAGMEYGVWGTRGWQISVP